MAIITSEDSKIRNVSWFNLKVPLENLDLGLQSQHLGG